MKISNKGLKFIKYMEGFRSSPYLDSGGVPTVGYGSTFYTNGIGVKITDPEITEKEAEKLLMNVVVRFETIVNEKIKIELNQNQFDALVSHAYNTGGSATLFEMVNGLGMWWLNTYITSGGKKLNGLINRREKEYKMFLGE